MQRLERDAIDWIFNPQLSDNSVYNRDFWDKTNYLYIEFISIMIILILILIMKTTTSTRKLCTDLIELTLSLSVLKRLVTCTCDTRARRKVLRIEDGWREMRGIKELRRASVKAKSRTRPKEEKIEDGGWERERSEYGEWAMCVSRCGVVSGAETPGMWLRYSLLPSSYTWHLTDGSEPRMVEKKTKLQQQRSSTWHLSLLVSEKENNRTEEERSLWECCDLWLCK